MSQKTKDILLKIAVNACRLMLATTFIFSGFVKANDPYGTAYKMADYLAAWSIEMPDTLVLVAAVILSTIESVLGLYLLFGISRRPTARLTWAFMAVMLLFTVYTAIFNPVDDCGCFGDAIILTNTETLAKNIILFAAAFVLMRYYELQIKVISKNTEWLISIFSNIYILLLAGYSITSLPIIDFRPYYTGADLRKAISIPDDQRPQFDVKIVYEKDGKTMELGIDDEDPDSTWTYVETKRIPISAPQKAAIVSDFYINDANGEDITRELLDNEGYSFLIIAPQLQNASQGYIGDINYTYDYAKDNGYGFYFITASDTTQQNYWTEHTGAEYNIHIGDERTLKTIVRSSPGLVLLKDGKIIRKCSTYKLPDEETLTGKLEDIEFGQTDAISRQRKIINLLLLFILPLLALTVLDRMAARWSAYRKLKRKSKDFQLENIERALGLEKSETTTNSSDTNTEHNNQL